MKTICHKHFALDTFFLCSVGQQVYLSSYLVLKFFAKIKASMFLKNCSYKNRSVGPSSRNKGPKTKRTKEMIY